MLYSSLMSLKIKKEYGFKLFLIIDALRIKHVASPVRLLNTGLNETILNLKCVWMETHRDPQPTYRV